jgi:serine/threonine protein kinase
MTEAASRLTAALADRYRLERELGAGGVATLYLAEDLKHRRKVAVKVLRPELALALAAALLPSPKRARHVTRQAGIVPDSNPAMRCNIPSASHD